MNFVLVNLPEQALSLHPLYLKVQELFPNVNLDVNDSLQGRSLKALEQGSISIEDYIVGNMFKKVRTDLGLQPSVRVRAATIADLERNKVWDIKTRYILANGHNTPLGTILEKTRSIIHDMCNDFDPYKIVPRHTFGATEFLSRDADIYSRMRSADSNSLNPLNNNALKHWLLYQAGALDLDKQRQIYDPTKKTWISLPDNRGDGTYVLFSSVGKQATIDRPIGYHEPLQLSVQNGIGDYLVSCLRKQGINMVTAQDTHRELAQLWSLEPGTLATMDQSNSSQNILRSFVEYLFPTPLFNFMDAVTPRHIIIDEQRYGLHMMAAQGNGYNSALQTIVYYALISAVAWYMGVKTQVYQYGDDSIFSAKIFDQVVSVFTALGFQVNLEKSFTSHVLESCGMDAMHGQNVRPFYVKNLPRSPREWYHVCNGIYRVGYFNNSNSWRSAAYKRLWLWCIGNIPSHERLYGPLSYGDDVITTHQCDKYVTNSSGTKIRSYSSRKECEYRFSQVVQGLKAHNVFSLLPQPSLKGSGLRYSRKDDELFYPKSLGYSQTVYGSHWVPRIQSVITNDDDIDAIFASLSLTGDELIHRYQAKLLAQRYKLILGLKRYVQKRKDIELDVTFKPF